MEMTLTDFLVAIGIDPSGINLDELQVRKLLIAMGIVVGAYIFVWLLRRALSKWAAVVPERSRAQVERWYPVLRLVVQVVTLILVVMLVTSSPIPTFVSALVAIGVIMRDFFSSIIAGVVAMWEMPYRQGDWVSLGGHYGKVAEMGVRAVRLVTPDDTVVVVPHSIIWNEVVANANDGQPEHLCVADFYLHPTHDARKAREKLRDVAITSPYIQLDKDIAVIVLEKPWGTHYRVKAYPVSSNDEFHFVSDLTVRGKEALLAMGCQPAVAPPAVAA